jgi:hypothetical protein
MLFPVMQFCAEVREIWASGDFVEHNQFEKFFPAKINSFYAAKVYNF